MGARTADPRGTDTQAGTRGSLRLALPSSLPDGTSTVAGDADRGETCPSSEPTTVLCVTAGDRVALPGAVFWIPLLDTPVY